MGRYRFRAKRPIADRFWSKVEKTDGCWLWQGAKDRKGYGVVGLGGRTDGIARAHRVAWGLTNGEPPADRMVLHLCDTKACVNPSHLVLGNHTENMRQAKERHLMTATNRRTVRGVRHWKAKLTDDEVDAIRSRRAAGETLRTIAAAFGVSQAHVSRIARGQARTLPYGAKT